MRWTRLSALLPFLLLPTFINAQGGLGDTCTATDGTVTGFNPSCLSGMRFPSLCLPNGSFTDKYSAGFCRYGQCSDPTSRNVGETCTADNQCANAEVNDQPPSCGGRPGDSTLVCGGTSSYCFASDSSGLGPSPICASGKTPSCHVET